MRLLAGIFAIFLINQVAIVRAQSPEDTTGELTLYADRMLFEDGTRMTASGDVCTFCVYTIGKSADPRQPSTGENRRAPCANARGSPIE